MEPVMTTVFASSARMAPYKTPWALPAIAIATPSGLTEIIRPGTAIVKPSGISTALRRVMIQLEWSAEIKPLDWTIRVWGRTCSAILVMVECAGIVTIALPAGTMRFNSYAPMIIASERQLIHSSKWEIQIKTTTNYTENKTRQDLLSIIIITYCCFLCTQCYAEHKLFWIRYI